jgi:hypothetical protein
VDVGHDGDVGDACRAPEALQHSGDGGGEGLSEPCVEGGFSHGVPREGGGHRR